MLAFFSLAEDSNNSSGGGGTNVSGGNCAAPIPEDIFLTIEDVNTWETCSNTLPGDQTIVDRMCELSGNIGVELHPDDIFTASQDDFDKFVMVATLSGECSDGNPFSFSYTYRAGLAAGLQHSMTIVDQLGNEISSGFDWCRYHQNFEPIRIRLPALDVGEGGISIGFMLSTPCIVDCSANNTWTRTFMESVSIPNPGNPGGSPTWHHIDLMDTGSPSNEGCPL